MISVHFCFILIIELLGKIVLLWEKVTSRLPKADWLSEEHSPTNHLSRNQIQFYHTNAFMRSIKIDGEEARVCLFFIFGSTVQGRLRRASSQIRTYQRKEDLEYTRLRLVNQAIGRGWKTVYDVDSWAPGNTIHIFLFDI